MGQPTLPSYNSVVGMGPRKPRNICTVALVRIHHINQSHSGPATGLVSGLRTAASEERAARHLLRVIPPTPPSPQLWPPPFKYLGFWEVLSLLRGAQMLPSSTGRARAGCWGQLGQGSAANICAGPKAARPPEITSHSETRSRPIIIDSVLISSLFV